MASDGHHSRTLLCDEQSGQRKALKESGGAVCRRGYFDTSQPINGVQGWLGLSAGVCRDWNIQGISTG
jgi:hypothetical protein